MPQYFLGYDIGTSFVKASLLDAETGITVASASAPDVEMSISSPQKGWAEQEPEMWWSATIEATKRLKHRLTFDPNEVLSIGISYQMHGLVVIDREGKPLRPSIIWCDSRAVETGEKAFRSLGTAFCLFNTSKVQLEDGIDLHSHLARINFNTSKVQLEGHCCLIRFDMLTNFNTSKVQLEAQCFGGSLVRFAYFNTSKVQLEGLMQMGLQSLKEDFNTSKVQLEV